MLLNFHEPVLVQIFLIKLKGFVALTMSLFLQMCGIFLGALLMGTAILHLIPKLGRGGNKLTGFLSTAPGLDIVVTYFTVLPLIVGAVVAGWQGVLAGVLAQFLTVYIWSILHSFANPAARKGPRILKVLNRLVGPLRNHVALWVTAIVVPVFWVIRVAEIFVYPFLIWLVRFPKYRQDEWVRVSRHKFKNLVGHDLIWCLYCDWMTGVWSLGSEMLRNVESFWCPIRFDSSKKCENCRHDFPDVFNGWVAADSDMQSVTEVLKIQYGDAKVYSWNGHTDRLTDSKEKSESSD